jgi:ABC-type branched-subunit amino acid transport system substrate-binding protein
VVGGVAAWYVSRPPPPTPTPTHAIVGQVTIGFPGSLTGADAVLGEEFLYGAQLAVSVINSQGGIYLANGPNGPGNYTINLVWQDDQSSPSVAPTAAMTLITEYHPAIVFGSTASVDFMAQLPIYQRYVVPVIFSGATVLSTRTKNMTNFDPSKFMVFHYMPTSLEDGVAAAEFLYQERSAILSAEGQNPNGSLRIAFLYQNTELGTYAFIPFNQTIYKNGWQNQLQIVYSSAYPFGNTQFQSILTAAAAARPNVIVTASWTPEQVAINEQAADIPALKGVPILATMQVADDVSVYQPAGPAANGLITYPDVFSELSNTSNPAINAKWQVFRNMYYAYTGHPGSFQSASGWDDAWIAAYALKDAGSTNNTAIIHALETMPPPPQLVLLAKPTPQGTLFNSFHEVSFMGIAVEAFYNSTSNSVYTEVVWPPQYATVSPQFGIFP